MAWTDPLHRGGASQLSSRCDTECTLPKPQAAQPKSVVPELLTLTVAALFLQESATAETQARFRRGLGDTPLVFRRVHPDPTRGRSLGIWTIFIAQASLLAVLEGARVWWSVQSGSLASTAGEVPSSRVTARRRRRSGARSSEAPTRGTGSTRGGPL